MDEKKLTNAVELDDDALESAAGGANELETPDIIQVETTPKKKPNKSPKPNPGQNNPN